MWVALYCRRSVDPADLGVSVHVQERNGRRYATEHFPGLSVQVYTDNDLSAANPSVTRPAYQRLIEDVRGGRVAQVVVREQSRLTRQPAEWESLCTTLQLAGIGAVHQTHGGPVSVTEGSRLPGRIMAVVDAEYVEQVRVKVRGALAVNAEEGRPHARAGYGYRRTVIDGRPALEPDPETAPIAAQMVRDIAAGTSLGLVAQRLNETHTPTPNGAAEWGRATVRAIVTAPRLIGQRVHKDKVTDAQWEPIIDRDTWNRARTRLEQNRPGYTSDRRRQYLLTGGLAACAACRQPLISSTTRVRGVPVASYRCPGKAINADSCGGCSILADRLEDHITAAISRQLEDPDYLDAVNRLLAAGTVDTGPILRELNQVDARRADLAVKWAAGEFDDIEHAAASRHLNEQRQQLVGQLAAVPAEPVTLDRLLLAWEQGGMARRPLIPVLAQTPILVTGAFRDGRRLSVAERIDIRRGTSSA